MSFEKMNDQQIWDIANPIMDNLLEASTLIDHARHVHDFTDRLKAIVTAEYLQRVCQQYQSEKAIFLPAFPPRFSDDRTQWPSCGNNTSPKHRVSLSQKWCCCIEMEDTWWIM